MTPNPVFKVTMLKSNNVNMSKTEHLKTKLLKDANRKSKAGCRLVYQFQWPWVTPDPDFKVAAFFEIKYAKTVQDGAIVTIEHKYEVIYNLSNGAVSSDVEWLYS